MGTHPGIDVGCLVLPEFIEEADPPKDLHYHLGEPIHPQAVVSFVDTGSGEAGGKQFTVLLRDNRVVTVRGNGLKYLPNASPSDPGSYAVVAPDPGGEVIVALFRVSEVTGIFSGNLHPPRESA